MLQFDWVCVWVWTCSNKMNTSVILPPNSTAIAHWSNCNQPICWVTTHPSAGLQPTLSLNILSKNPLVYLDLLNCTVVLFSFWLQLKPSQLRLQPEPSQLDYNPSQAKLKQDWWQVSYFSPASTQPRAMKFCTQVQLNLLIRVGQEKI